MTIDETRQPDDELDAFLEGESDLSRRLKQLSQPSPPAEVSAAVLANIEAALIMEKVAPATANDPATTGAAGGRRPRLSSRWSMPLAFAASILLGVMINLQWRATHERDQVALAQRPPAHAGHPSVAREYPPVADAGTAAETEPAAPAIAAPSRPASVHGKPAVRAAAPAISAPPPAPIMVAQASIPSASTQTVVTTGIRPSLQQSLNVKRHAVAHVEVVTAEDVGKMPDKNVADSLQRMPGTAVAESEAKNSPAPEQKRNATGDIDVVGADDDAAASPEARKPEPAAKTQAKAKDWLALIEKKIRLGKEREALDEWTKFRKAYPDFPIPDALTEKIKALQRK